MPAPDPAVIARPRLLNPPLDVASARPITVITAPIGYGKTTLLAQWCRALLAAHCHVAWYTFDADDDEPFTFLAYFAAALHRARIDVGTLHIALSSGTVDSSPQRVLRTLIAALERASNPVFIMLDDHHRLSNASGSLPLITLLMERLPAGVHLVLSGRHRPPLRLAALHANDQVAWLKADDLQFSLEETATFLGRRASGAEAETIHRQVEGWPVGVHLARRHLQVGGRAPLADEVVVMRQECGEVFAEQVVSGLPPATREVLLKISILERMTGSLVERLTQCRDGAKLLEELAGGELFLRPMDGERKWFRFHAMFAEFLRGQLRAQFPDAVPDLHRLASEWFAAYGYLSEAATHATACGDDSLLREILLRAGGWRLLLRDGVPHFRVFRELPESVTRQAPSLQLGQIYVMIRDRRLRAAQTALNECLLALDGLPPHEAEVARCRALTLEFLLRSVCGPAVQAAEIEALQADAWKAAAGDDDLMISVGNTMAWGWLLAGEFNRSLEVAAVTVDRCVSRATPFLEKYARLAASMSHLELGQLPRALALLRRDLPGKHESYDVITQILEADAACERGDFAAAKERVLPILAELDGSNLEFDFNCTAYRVAFSLSDATEASDIETRCKRLAARSDQPQLGVVALICWARHAIWSGRIAELRAEHTDALFQLVASELNSWRIDELRRLTRAEYALVMGRSRQAVDEACELCTELAQRGHVRYLLRAMIVHALALEACGQAEAAASLIDTVLAKVVETDMSLPLLEYSTRLEGLLASAAQRHVSSSPAIVALLDVVRLNTPSSKQGPAQTAEGLLSPREQEILHALAVGDTSKEAASKLGISINTVMFHRRNIYRKLDCVTRSQVLAVARSRGLLS